MIIALIILSIMCVICFCGFLVNASDISNLYEENQTLKEANFNTLLFMSKEMNLKTNGMKVYTVRDLKALGFTHVYDSEIEDSGTPDEFSYSVFMLPIKCYNLEATIEYDAYKQPKCTQFYMEEIEFTGRPLTIADINLLKEIL